MFRSRAWKTTLSISSSCKSMALVVLHMLWYPAQRLYILRAQYIIVLDVLLGPVVDMMVALPISGSTECLKKSIEAKCYYTMPVCEEPPGGPDRARRLCRDECEALWPLCKDGFKGSYLTPSHIRVWVVKHQVLNSGSSDLESTPWS